MSRSKRHTSICGMTNASSDKQDKRRANRKFRRVNKVNVAKDQDPQQMRELCNVYNFAKDGRQYFTNDDALYGRPSFTPFWRLMAK